MFDHRRKDEWGLRTWSLDNGEFGANSIAASDLTVHPRENLRL